MFNCATFLEPEPETALPSGGAVVMMTTLVTIYFALRVYSLLRAYSLVRSYPRSPGRSLWALACLLPQDDAHTWVQSHRGFLADIPDRRTRRKYMIHLVWRMPSQLWTSWSIHLHRRYQTRELAGFAAILQFDTGQPGERPAWPAVLALSIDDMRALWRGSAIWMQSTHGRQITVRLRHRSRRPSR